MILIEALTKIKRINIYSDQPLTVKEDLVYVNDEALQLPCAVNTIKQRDTHLTASMTSEIVHLGEEQGIEDVISVSCRECGGSIMQPDVSLTKTIGLPSEHWHELIDCWMCHKETYSTIQKKHIHGTLPGQQGVVQLGSAFIGLHAADLTVEFAIDKVN